MEPLGPHDPVRVGDYELRGRLGMGGMGRVFLGVGPDDRRVAVKLMHEPLVQDPEFRSRFRREVAAARRVSGLYTAAVVDADPDAATPWLATEFVDGRSLDVVITSDGPMATAEVRALATGLAQALDAVHTAGVVHRDLKPSNVMLGPDGPRLIDFGIARALDGTRVTRTGSTIGTPGFMSPEQVRGEEPDPSSDVFALGAVLHFAATGEGPFGTGSAHALLYRVVNGEPDLARLESGPLQDIVGACLAKDPALRPRPRDILGRGEEPTAKVPAWGAAVTERVDSGVTRVVDAPATEHISAPGGRQAPWGSPPTPPVDPWRSPAGEAGPGGGPPLLRRRGVRLAAAGLAVVLAGVSGIVGWNQFAGGDETPADVLRLGFEAEPESYNTTTLEGGTQPSAVIANVLQSGFSRPAADGSIEELTDFGYATQVADSPLRVRYSINQKAVWSDGTPITCDDAVLTWMALGNQFTPDKFQDDDYVGFDPGSPAGYERMYRPDCSSGSKEFLVTFRESYADWRGLFGQTAILPSHIVRKQAQIERSFPEMAADQTPDPDELARVANFWTNGWDLDPAKLDTSLMPSSGPYVLDSWVKGASLKLKANPRWWGKKPLTNEIEVRFASGPQLVSMLGRQEIDVITPFAQDLPALLTELRKIDGVTATTAPTTAVDLLVFNTEGKLASRELREALVRCTPRQQIVDELIKPSQPDGQVLQTRLVTPAQAGYDEVAAAAGGSAFADVHLAGTRALLTANDAPNLTIRLGWYKPEGGGGTSDRRAQVLRLMQDSCRQAGLVIEDGGSDSFLQDAYDPEKRDWDVALMGWSLEPGVATGDDLYHTYEGIHGKYNLGNYSNAELDGLLEEYGEELDPVLRRDTLREIEELMWQDLPSLPLYALPDIVATAPGITGVQLNATEAGLTWNAAEWDLTDAT